VGREPSATSTAPEFNPFVKAPATPEPPSQTQVPSAPSIAVAATSLTAPAALPPGLPENAAQPPAPPLAPAAPAPSAPVDLTSPAAAAVTVPHDSKGLPWDHRIHSPSKTQNQDGTWRQKKGVDKTILSAVERELMQAMAASAPPKPPGEATAPLPEVSFGELMKVMSPLLENGSISNAALVLTLGEFKLANLIQLATRPDLVPAFAARMQPHILKAMAAV
jgi:hypothetical protein